MRIFLIIFAGLAFNSWGLAYGPCDADAERICTKGNLHAETLRTCLHFQVELVKDPNCQDFLKKNAPEWDSFLASFKMVQDSCKTELRELCPSVEAEKRQLKAQQTCLMSEKDKLSSSCKEAINAHIRSQQPQIREIN